MPKKIKKPLMLSSGFKAKKGDHIIRVMTQAYIVGAYMAIYNTETGSQPMQIVKSYKGVNAWISKMKISLASQGFKVDDFGEHAIPTTLH